MDLEYSVITIVEDYCRFPVDQTVRAMYVAVEAGPMHASHCFPAHFDSN